MIHILPNSIIPFASLPLDVLIFNKSNYLKIQQEMAFDDAK